MNIQHRASNIQFPAFSPTARPLSRWTRVVFFFAGVLLPLICLLVAAGNFEGEWQSGNLHDYSGYLLRFPAGAPFYPFLAYMMFCLLSVLLDERRARFFAIRGGLYTGVVLAIQYAVVLTVKIFEMPALLHPALLAIPIVGTIAMLIGLAAWWGLWWPIVWAPRLWAYINRHRFGAPRLMLLATMWMALAAVTVLFFTLAVPKAGEVFVAPSSSPAF